MAAWEIGKLSGKFVLAAVMSVVLAAGALAGPLEEAVAASEKGDYAQALRLLAPLAAEGNAYAQTSLGILYFHGQGVIQDYQEAFKWYHSAAEQGHLAAQRSLGALYSLGLGTPMDKVSAYMWFNLSAAQGDEQAARGREITSSVMTPDQLTEGQRRSRDCISSNYVGC